MYDIIKRINGDREKTAQEAALDALGIPPIMYSCSTEYVQANRPEETQHILKPRKMRDKTVNNKKLSAFLFDVHATKYVKSTL
jgi:hypothetical protein